MTAHTTQQTFTYLQSVYRPVSEHESLAIIYQVIGTQNQQITQHIRNVQQAIQLYGKKSTLGHVEWELKKKGEEKTAQYFNEATGKFGWHNPATPEARAARVKNLDQLKQHLKNRLPSVIFSGVIPRGASKTADDVTGHTGFIIGDLDKIAPDRLEHALRILRRWSHTALLFRSPSGNGIKVLVPVDFDFSGVTDWNRDKTHQIVTKQALQAIERELSSQGIKADLTGINVNRHCFLPYDPSVYLDIFADPLPIDREALERKLAYIEQKRREREAMGAAGNLENLSFEQRIERAIWFAENTYQFQEGEKHNYLNRLAIAGKSLGIPEEELKAWVYENLISEWDISSNPWTPYDSDNYGWSDWDDYRSGFAEPPKQGGILTNPCHLSELKSDVLTAVEPEKIVSIQSPTGSGKTYATLAETDDYTGFAHELIKQHPGTQARFATPTQILTEQTAQDDSINLPYITGNVQKELRAAAKLAPAAISTYDLLGQSINDIKNTHLFIDEWHEIAEAVTYRGEVCKQVYDLVRAAKTATLLSATPPPFLDLLGITYKRFGLPKLNRVEIEARSYSGSQIQLLKTELCKLSAAELQSGLFPVYMNGKAKARTLRKRLEKKLSGKLKGRRIAIINSDQRETPDFQHLIQHREIASDVAIVLVTKLIGAGINIYNTNVDRIYYCDPKSKSHYPNPNDFIQFVARFRKMAVLPVVHYFQKRDGGKAIDPKALFTAEIDKAKADVSRIEAQRKIAGILQEDTEYKALRQTHDEARFIRKNSLSGEWEPDYLEIWSFVWGKYLTSLSTARYFDRILEGNENFAITGLATHQTANFDRELNELEKADQEAEKLADMQLTDMLTREPAGAYCASFHTCGDQGVKKAIKKHLGHQVENLTPMAQYLLEQYPDTFKNSSFRPVLYSLEIEQAGFNRKEIAGIFTTLSQSETRDKLERLTAAIGKHTQAIEKGNYWREQVSGIRNKGKQLGQKVSAWRTSQQKAIAKYQKKIDYWAYKKTDNAGEQLKKAQEAKAKKAVYYDNLIQRSINTHRKQKDSIQAKYEAKNKELAIISTKLESCKRELAFIEKHADKIYFSHERFKAFCSQLETLKIAHLARTISERRHLSEENAIKGSLYNKFARYFRNWKRGDKYTREHIEKAFLKLRYPDMTPVQLEREFDNLDPTKDGPGMSRFKELFTYRVERSKIKAFYIIKSKVCVTNFGHRHGFGFESWLGENKQYKPVKADSSQTIHNNEGYTSTPINNIDKVPTPLNIVNSSPAYIPQVSPRQIIINNVEPLSEAPF